MLKFTLESWRSTVDTPAGARELALELNAQVDSRANGRVDARDLTVQLKGLVDAQGDGQELMVKSWPSRVDAQEFTLGLTVWSSIQLTFH